MIRHRRRRTAMTSAVILAGALLATGTPSPAQADEVLGITGVAYAADALDLTRLPQDIPVAPVDCGYVVGFSGPAPASTYAVSVSPADVDVASAAAVEFDPSTGTGVARVGCIDADGGSLVPGTSYTLTIEDRDASGAPVGSVSTTTTYERATTPTGLSLRIGDAPVAGELPTQRTISFDWEGSWSADTTFTNLTTALPAGSDPLDPSLDRTEVRRVSFATGRAAPATSININRQLDGRDVFVSVRADEPGKDGAVLVVDAGRAVTIPTVLPMPSDFIQWPGNRFGYPAKVGQLSGMTAPTLSQSAINVGVTPSYQWFNGMDPIPGATGPTYTPPASMVGRALTVQLTFSAPGYVTKVGGRSFTTVRRIAVPSGWLTSPARKAGEARAGTTASVTGAELTHTAVVSGAKVYYQWFLDGRKIPGATGRTYQIPTSARGGELTVGIAVAKPGLNSLTGKLSYGRVR